jgi:class 3 adenylate cyclase
MGTVSHELRSPLHGICGLAACLEKGEQDEKRRKQIGMVRSCSTRLLDLVVNIMDMAAQRNERHKSLAKDPVHLVAIVDEVVALIACAQDKAMQPLLSEDCKLVNKVAGTALPLVEGDSYKLTQVFFNLLTNACKFCRRGHIEVTAETDRAERLVRISVSDTGIGIAPGALKRIFEPFEQEDSTVGRCFEGIGLGLSVSEGVVRQHGGEISVKSVQGQGSVFTVSLPFLSDAAPLPETMSSSQSLPVTPEDAPVCPDPASASAASQELAVFRAPRRRPSLSQAYSMMAGEQVQVDAAMPARRADDAGLARTKPTSGLTPDVQIAPQPHARIGVATTITARPVVLSVDDDAVNQEVVISALAEYEVHTAMDGAAALRYFAKNSRIPDVVLLDIMMPGMSGYEVCTEIRNQLQLPASTLPIIMLSAKEPAAESTIQGLGYGCNDYIEKPFDVSVLKARVSTALQVKRLHQVEIEHAEHAKLLHEIMPPHIVQRLISGESCIAESHHCVTILFSDIVGWTNIAESISTSAVITLLNELFSAFDKKLEEHGVFKVETIGDAYMVAAGHDGCKDHARRVMLMGLSMLAAARAVRPPPGMRLQIRVGVNSGPAFTGVVGHKVPRFCFFGDTVNVASRMESTGVPGCIHISQAARDCLGDVDLAGASVVSRGTIDVKGKGRMETHFVVPSGVALPPLEQLGQGDCGASPTKKPPGPQEGGDGEKLLQAQLAEAQAALAALRSERDELRKRGSELERAMQAAASQAVALSPPSHLTPKRFDDAASRLCSSPADTSTRGSFLSTASHGNTTSLRVELAVKKKALERARRALLEKDDELDAKEVELQYALASLSDAGLAQAVMTAASSEDGQMQHLL